MVDIEHSNSIVAELHLRDMHPALIWVLNPPLPDSITPTAMVPEGRFQKPWNQPPVCPVLWL